MMTFEQKWNEMFAAIKAEFGAALEEIARESNPDATEGEILRIVQNSLRTLTAKQFL